MRCALVVNAHVKGWARGLVETSRAGAVQFATEASDNEVRWRTQSCWQYLKWI
jgi:hypothetical protein